MILRVEPFVEAVVDNKFKRQYLEIEIGDL
jgi:hypothetical protein